MSAVATAKARMDLKEVQYLIHRKDGITYEDVEAIFSNLYQQNQKMDSMEKEMAEFRAVVMKQRETMEKTDKVVAQLKSRINEQDREIVIMKQEIRKLKTNVNGKETILKQVLQENQKCVDELQFAKQSIEDIERVVKNKQSHAHIENTPRKAIIQNNKVKFSQNKKIVKSSRETNQVLDQITSMRTGNNVSIGKVPGVNNITTLKTGINNVSMSSLYQGGKYIIKQFRNGKGVLSKKDIATGGIAFSAYLDHEALHLGIGHTIKCNQVLLNEGNHYNTFTGIFTVPHTGIYLLTFNIGGEHINDLTQVRLMVNNRAIVDAAVQVLGSFQRVSSGNTAIIKLNIGESVWLESELKDSEAISGSRYRWTTFSGVLLY